MLVSSAPYEHRPQRQANHSSLPDRGATTGRGFKSRSRSHLILASTPKSRSLRTVWLLHPAAVPAELQRDGYSMPNIVVELERHKIETPRGGTSHPQLV
jgi:hypothetical protein